MGKRKGWMINGDDWEREGLGEGEGKRRKEKGKEGEERVGGDG